MNTKLIDTFITVAQYDSINSAAEALFISPPALQQQLNRLEKEIGFRLFDRGPGGIRLTAAGAVFLDGLTKIRSDMETLISRCAQIASAARSLSIGAIQGLQPDLFPRISGPFYLKHPGVILKPVMESEDRLFEELDCGALDAIEYYDCPRARACGRHFEELLREGRDCLMSPNHPLANRAELTLEDLRGQHIIVFRFDRIPGFREYVSENYPDIRLSEDPRIVDFYAMVRTFEDGHIGLLPPHVRSQFQPLKTVPLRMDLKWPLGLVYREPCGPLLRQFIETAREVFS